MYCLQRALFLVFTFLCSFTVLIALLSADHFFVFGDLYTCLPWYAKLALWLAEPWIYYLGGGAYWFMGGIGLYAAFAMKSGWKPLPEQIVGFLVSGVSLAAASVYAGYSNLLGQWVVAYVQSFSTILTPYLLLVSFFCGLLLLLQCIFVPYVCPVAWLLMQGVYLLKRCGMWFYHFLRPLAAQHKENERIIVLHEYQELLAQQDLLMSDDTFWQQYSTSDRERDTGDTEQKTVPASGVRKQANKGALLPSLEIFKNSGCDERASAELMKELEQKADLLYDKLQRFGVEGQVTAINPGPVVTLFEFTPAADAKISKIISLEDDLALALETKSLRIIAPIPGRSVVGFEVANKTRQYVLLADLMKADEMQAFRHSIERGHGFEGKLLAPLGEDIIGTPVFVDIVRMPHILVAGSTGSGKSVSLNSILVSLLCSNPPRRLRLVLIDPKRLEFAQYADIAHLLFPIITDPKRAILALRWVVAEMEQRYEQMSHMGVRNIEEYNKLVADEVEELSFILVIIDELADLMMTAGKDVEFLVTRLAQMARAAGIHMIVATQRPSVDVVTGIIKVNFPSRLSFRVASRADSRTILDSNGADKLLGNGDMLFLNSQDSELRRVHGAYVSDEEIENVVSFIKERYDTHYVERDITLLKQDSLMGGSEVGDEVYGEVLVFLQEIDEVSISLLQRKFRIGYNRSARIMEALEQEGYVLVSEGGKMRKVVKERLE